MLVRWLSNKRRRGGTGTGGIEKGGPETVCWSNAVVRGRVRTRIEHTGSVGAAPSQIGVPYGHPRGTVLPRATEPDPLRCRRSTRPRHTLRKTMGRASASITVPGRAAEAE